MANRHIEFTKSPKSREPEQRELVVLRPIPGVPPSDLVSITLGGTPMAVTHATLVELRRDKGVWSQDLLMREQLLEQIDGSRALVARLAEQTRKNQADVRAYELALEVARSAEGPGDSAAMVTDGPDEQSRSEVIES